MKNKLVLIIAIVCVALIGYLLSLKKQEMALAPAAPTLMTPVTPATQPTTLNNAPTTIPAPDGAMAPLPTQAGTSEVDGVPTGAPAPAEAGTAMDQGVGAPVVAPAPVAPAAGVMEPAPATITPAPAPAGVQQ